MMLPVSLPYFFVKNKEIKTDGYTTITIQINNLPPELKALKFRVTSGDTVKETKVNLNQLVKIKQDKWQYTWQGLIPVGMIQIRLMDENGTDICKPKKEIITLLNTVGLHSFKNKKSTPLDKDITNSSTPYNLDIKDINGVKTVFIVVAEKSTGRTLFQYLGTPKHDFTFETEVENLLLLVKGYRVDGSNFDPHFSLKPSGQ